MLDKTTTPLKSLKCYKSVQLLPIFSPISYNSFPKTLACIAKIVHNENVLSFRVTFRNPNNSFVSLSNFAAK